MQKNDVNTKGSLIEWICLAISSTLYTGFLPGFILGKPGKAGGTAGALVALMVQLYFHDASNVWFLTVLMVASFFVGMIVAVPAEQFMLRRWGARKRHTGELVEGDFNETNIDEFHGQLLAGLPLWFFPRHGITQVVLLLLSFALFRFFDTRKPGFIGEIERRTKGGGFGIMIDDTAAGVVSAVIITVILF